MVEEQKPKTLTVRFEDETLRNIEEAYDLLHKEYGIRTVRVLGSLSVNSLS